MGTIYIFSGTSEGRELSEYLSKNHIDHRVFVATEYGRNIMKKSDHARIFQGRLNKEDMEKMFLTEEPACVYDATHPYAAEVSENIREALLETGYGDRLVRIERALEKVCLQDAGEYPGFRLRTAGSVEEAIAMLEDIPGEILLTTGVKTLHAYMSSDALKDRITARILPSEESLSLAMETGISAGKIIAMEGPFITSVNEALIDQFHISVMVTKDSGEKGGFNQKLEACRNKGITLVVIGGAKKIPGISLEEAKTCIAESFGLSAEQDKEKEKDGTTEPSTCLRLTVVGIGAGDERSLTLEAVKRIESAELLTGAQRMLDIAGRFNKTAVRVKAYERREVIRSVIDHGLENNVFLVSGDTGFYSGAYALCDADGTCSCKIETEVLPGISSISYLCSLVKVPYSGVELLSSHGRPFDVGSRIDKKESFFALTSGRDDFNRIAEEVRNRDKKCTLIKGFNLGMADQAAEKITIDHYIPAEKEGLYVIGIIFGDEF